MTKPMMHHRTITLLCLFAMQMLGSTTLWNAYTCHAASVGTWKAYMAYSNIKEIEQAGNIYYVLASDNLYAYNTQDESVTTYHKMNFLSDCGIDHIAWNPASKRLVIVYANQNIDLIDRSNNVYNVSAYYQKSLTDDKTIFDIYIYQQYAYISTGFGILKLNTATAEISDSYNLGFQVNYCYIEGNRIYAQSQTNGCYAANLTDNLLDKSNWTRTGSYTSRTKTLDPLLTEAVANANPGGPLHNHFGFLKFHNGMLYTCRGYDSGNRSETTSEVAIQVMTAPDEWQIYQHEGISEQTGRGYFNMSALAIDARDPNHVFAGSRNGVYEFQDGKFTTYFNSENSPIQIFNMRSDSPSADYQMVTGAICDGEGNLWILNSLAESQSIIEFTTNRQWVSHNFPELISYSASNYPVDRSLPMLKGMFIDSRQLLWFVNDHWYTPSLYCFNPTTNELTSYTSFTNEDGTILTINNIHGVAEDLQGNIWVCTNLGPLMLTTDEMFQSNPVFEQVKVPRNDGTDYADYLLSGVDITCMAIDGGGRKWFGTNGNGIYLISADNITQLQHFTAENSQLLSNNIEALAINGTTGEVFMGTDHGLCSYMSDATNTAESMSKSSVYAYPNPVRPDYSGPITVVGLSLDADVKIVTASGTLVAQGRSNGGSFIWDGCDLKGNRVASGVYMVETATSSGGKGTVCKIAVVN